MCQRERGGIALRGSRRGARLDRGGCKQLLCVLCSVLTVEARMRLRHGA